MRGFPSFCFPRLGHRAAPVINTQLLIDSIVRQVAVLIAQLPTAGGVRAPVAHLANQVFVDLAHELEAQGVSRKVSADMFGTALRGYLRKLQRLTEGQSDTGRTLWQSVLDYIVATRLATRADILRRFKQDAQLQVSAVLRDLGGPGALRARGGHLYRDTEFRGRPRGDAKLDTLGAGCPNQRALTLISRSWVDNGTSAGGRLASGCRCRFTTGAIGRSFA
jgi:hypothetical protein